jgi:aminoglycoside phosphotransferase (APT) family kinase protein
MEFCGGRPLLELMNDDLHDRRVESSDVNSALRESARVLAEFHRIPPTEVEMQPANRMNQSFIDGLKKQLRSPVLQKPLRSVCREIDRLVESLSSAFVTRIDGRIYVNDAQPKNIIVEPGGQPVYIDLDYSCGPPGLNVGQFLAALHRMQLRHVLHRRVSLFETWKNDFLCGYREHSEQTLNFEELRFFHIFALVHLMKAHISSTRIFRSYLARRYTTEIRRVLSANMPDPTAACPKSLLWK